MVSKLVITHVFHRYFRCQFYKKYHCLASAKMPINGNEQFTVTNGDHNHPQDIENIEALSFKKSLKQACIRERGNLKNIYERVASRWGI